MTHQLNIYKFCASNGSHKVSPSRSSGDTQFSISVSNSPPQHLSRCPLLASSFLFVFQNHRHILGSCVSLCIKPQKHGHPPLLFIFQNLMHTVTLNICHCSKSQTNTSSLTFSNFQTIILNHKHKPNIPSRNCTAAILLS